MSTRPLAPARGCVLLLFLAATPSAAQRVSVATVRARSGQELLGRPRGSAVSLALPIRGRVGIALSVERLRSEQNGVGIVCGGLINPDRCPIEPYDQTGHLSLTAIGADVRLVRLSVAEVAVQPQISWGKAKTSARGHDTGNRLASEKGQLGFSAGLELRLTPVRRLPLDFVLGAASGWVGPIKNAMLVDGYTPFDRWHSLRAFYVGGALAWRHGERSSAS